MCKHSTSRLTLTLILLLSFLPLAVTVNSQNNEIEIEGWDMSALDAKIADAVAKANATNARAEDRLAAATIYLTRANLFYIAGRPALYKLALGDFRRVLRFQPNNAEAQEKADQIISIYKEMGRPVPGNGSETDIYNDPSIHYKVKPQLISFSDDKPSTTISDGLPPDVAHVYEVSANIGQRISLSITSDDDSISFAIYQEYAGKSSLIVSGNKKWSGVVLSTEKYIVKVSSKKGGAAYNLKVTVR